MAKVSFTSIIAEIVGKLGGSVFQYSYGGYQLRTRVSPKNPQTQYQQLRRMDYGFIAASWRNLNTTQRNTFILSAHTAPAGFNLFINSNVNLILIGLPMISTYIPSSAPAGLSLEITEIDTSTFKVKASGSTNIVPAGCKLLFYATNLKEQTQIFTNPSEYSPIATFDEGTDMSIEQDVITQYISRFGQVLDNKYICIKSVCINKSNGSRSAEIISCSNTFIMANKYIPLKSFFTTSTNLSGGASEMNTFTIPANTLATNGDQLIMKIGFSTPGVVPTDDMMPIFGGILLSNFDMPTWKAGTATYVFVREANDIFKASCIAGDDMANSKFESQVITGFDFSIDSDLSLYVQNSVANAFQLFFTTIDLIKAP